MLGIGDSVIILMFRWGERLYLHRPFVPLVQLVVRGSARPHAGNFLLF